MVTFKKYKERVDEILDESNNKVLIEKTYTCVECGNFFKKEKNNIIKESKRSKKTNCNGVIVYHGVSNGENIVAIATGLLNPSKNRKTGPMVQIYILHADLSPTEASSQGKDIGVCGDCMHRKSLGGACYVNQGQDPLNIFNAYKNGKYPYIVSDVKKFQDSDITSVYVNDGMWDIFKRSYVRFGAYGDPAFIPIDIVEKIASNCKGFTGYTHQWKKTNSAYQKYFMASVDFSWEYDLAKKLGWRTFRVSPEWNIKKSGEMPCLFSLKDMQCVDCLLCCGTSKPNNKDIYVKVHGATVKRFIEQFGTDADNFDSTLTDRDLRNIKEIEDREKKEDDPKDNDEDPLMSLRRALDIGDEK